MAITKDGRVRAGFQNARGRLGPSKETPSTDSFECAAKGFQMGVDVSSELERRPTVY